MARLRAAISPPDVLSPALSALIPSKPLDWKFTAQPSDGSAKQTGMASWYGPGFHGKLTASGEVFNQHGMTAAHRTLPIPSFVRVRNVQTGKSVVVRINDRGPYHGDRILDLSQAAAQRIGAAGRPTMIEIEPITQESIRSGRWESDADAAQASSKTAAKKPTVERTVADAHPAKVSGPEAVKSKAAQTGTETQVAALSPAPTAVSTGPLQTLARERAGTTSGRGWWLHLAAFQNQDGADSFYNQIGNLIKGVDPLLTMFQDKSQRQVQAGPFSTRDEASKFGAKVRDLLSISPALLERK